MTASRLELSHHALGAVLACWLFGAPLARGQTVLGVDAGFYNVPVLELYGRLLRRGELPAWSPSLGLGHPFLADPGFHVFYPGNLLALVLDPLSAFNVLLALHVLLAHAGAFRLGRALGLSAAGAQVAALAYGFGGISASHVNSSFLAGGAWLPWAVLAAVWAARPGAPLHRTALAAVPFALIWLSSAAEFAPVAGLFTLVVAPAAGVPWRRATARLVPTAVVALLLAACSMVPFAAFAGETERQVQFSLEHASKRAVHPFEAIGLLVPRVFSAEALPLAWIQSPTQPWFTTLHLGAATLALLVPGVAAARSDRRARALLLVAFAGVAYALGTRSPLYRLAHDLVPIVSNLRFPAKQLVPAVLALSLLAGLGLDRARRGPRGVLAALCVAALLAAGVVVWGRAHDRPALVLYAALPLAGALVAGLVVALRPAGLARLLPLVLLLELAAAGRVAFEMAPRRVYERPALVAIVQHVEQGAGVPQRVVSLETNRLQLAQVAGAAEHGLASVQFAWRQALYPNSAAPYGLRSSGVFASFPLARERLLQGAARAGAFSRPHHLRLLGAALTVCTDADADVLAEAEPVARSGPFTLARLRGAPPWAAVYGAPQVVAGTDEAFSRIAAATFDPAATCVVEGAPALPPGQGPGQVGVATPLRLEDERLVLAVSSRAPGLLVVRDAWSRGWRASVDGAPAPVLRADLLFRGVVVPAGEHVVTLQYEAPGRTLGAALTALGLLVVAAALVLERRR